MIEAREEEPRKGGSEMKGTLVKRGNKVIGVQVGSEVFQGGEDENGIYILSVCSKCGSEFRNYLKGRGLIASVCPECKAKPKGRMRIEGDTLIVGKVKVKVKRAE